MSTDILTVQTNTATNVKRPDAFRRIQLVRGHRQQIATDFINIQTQSAYGLHCIGVEPEIFVSRYPSITHERADLSDWLNRPNLVIRHHDRDQDCVLT